MICVFRFVSVDSEFSWTAAKDILFQNVNIILWMEKQKVDAGWLTVTPAEDNVSTMCSDVTKGQNMTALVFVTSVFCNIALTIKT